jgi:hypothetical protein
MPICDKINHIPALSDPVEQYPVGYCSLGQMKRERTKNNAKGKGKTYEKRSNQKIM